MKITHIFKNTNQKFYEPYIKFISKNFNHKNHYFYIEHYSSNTTKESYVNNMEYVSKIQYIKLIKSMYTSERIIIHALMSPRLILILFLQPWLLNKCYWVIWGGDLYYRVMRKKTIRSNVYEYLRKSVIKKIGGFITHIKGDYELAKKWYGVKGQYYYSFMYPSNLYKEYFLNKNSDPTDRRYVQIGNSADPSNNHLEILEKLQTYKDMNIEIICPLSYGDRNYAEAVVDFGKKVYGNKFLPITDFMPFDKYLNLLAKVDVAIFNHKRQQAMGNITTLVGLGKKVYIREDITTWQFCIDHGIKVYSSTDGFEDLFEEMDEEIKQNNINNVKRKFSEEKLIKDWKKIFNEGALG